MRRSVASLQVVVFVLSLVFAWTTPTCDQMRCCKDGKICPMHSRKATERTNTDSMQCDHHAKKEKRDCSMLARCNDSEPRIVISTLGKMIVPEEAQLELSAATLAVAGSNTSAMSGFVFPPFEPPRA